MGKVITLDYIIEEVEYYANRKATRQEAKEILEAYEDGYAMLIEIIFDYYGLEA